ncbi:MAG: hypothetical protein GY750_03385 [Lentisphaerae bacterium]|nr:hypothetical protein [Lentisphaerota bacterium]
MSFLNLRFPIDISYGSSGGPNWNTKIVEYNSGHETRLQKWSRPRYSFDAVYGVRSVAQLNSLLATFHEARGSVHSFRYQDPQDYKVSDEPMTLDGTNASQLIKTYGSDANNFIRNITRPVGVTFKVNGGDYSPSLNYLTGAVALVSLSTKTITNITQATNGVVTAAAHGFSIGDVILLDNISGMTELNGVYATLTSVTTNTFHTGINTTTYTAYTIGGSADKFPQGTDVVTWSGEFDVPVRFATDKLSTQITSYKMGTTTVPLIEVKE